MGNVGDVVNYRRRDKSKEKFMTYEQAQALVDKKFLEWLEQKSHK